jgi:predicted nuclease of predicted toxin-antitoxin system
MRILFDQGTPAPLRRHLHPHSVDTVAERDWSTATNGDLLRLAEDDDYDVFITTDQNLRYQQNLKGRRLGLVVLMATSWPKIQKHIPAIELAITGVVGGGYKEVAIT